jgi:hypothetical protein
VEKMSHISKIECQICVNEQTYPILKQICTEMGATVCTDNTVIGVLENEKLSQGFVVKYKGTSIGVTAGEMGRLTIHADTFGASNIVSEFRTELEMRYKTKAVISALRQLGYTPKTKIEKQKVIIMGV